MGNVESITTIMLCVDETAKKHNRSTVDVFREIKELEPIQKALQISNLSSRHLFFTTPDLRRFFANIIEAQLFDIKGDSKCLSDITRWIQTPNKIGQGMFGTVYRGCIPFGNEESCTDRSPEFAVKLSIANRSSVQVPRERWFKNEAWSEAYVTQLIQERVLNDGKGQAVPRIYREFSCMDKCVIDDVENKSCTILITELADGTVEKWAENPSHDITDLWYHVLFQLMAGLAALQSSDLQLFHDDIKKENILFYRVKPGGHWRYEIGGKVYYLPNYGNVFVIADFGVSSLYSPEIVHQSEGRDKLGSRGLIRNADRGFCSLATISQVDPRSKTLCKMAYRRYNYTEIPDDVKTSLKPGFDTINGYTYNPDGDLNHGGCQYSNPIALSREEYGSINVSFFPPSAADYIRSKTGLEPKKAIFSIELLKRTDLYPPIEFGFDTQDMIKLFTGGKRSTQTNHHPGIFEIDIIFKEDLMNYLADGYNEQNQRSSKLSFYNHKMFAQDFIHHFFDKMFTKRIGQELGRFTCSL